MSNWSRPKKVISILAVFLMIFTGAYLIKNNNIFVNENQNDDFNQVIKYGNNFYMQYLYMNIEGNVSMGGGNGCLLKISDKGESYKVLLNKIPGCFAIGDSHIYYTEAFNPHGIYKMGTDGSNKKKIVDGNAIWIKYYKGWIYFVTGGEANGSENNSLYRVKTNGSGKEKLMSSVDRYVFYKDKIYFTRFGSFDSLESMKINGKNIKDVCKIGGGLFQISNGYVYYLLGGDLKGAPSDGNGMYLYRQRLDGSDKKKMLKEPIYYYHIFKNKIYYSTVDNKLYVTDLSFKRSELIKNEGAYIVCVDGKRIYLFDNDRNGLLSMNYNGKNLKKIFDLSKVKIK